MNNLISFISLVVLLFISPAAFAQTSQSTGLIGFVPLILLIVIFYFLLIRPQQKRAKEHKTLLKDLKKGDEVLTNGGVVAKITRVDETDTFISIEIAKGVEVKVQKQAINQRMPKGTFTTANGAKPTKKALTRKNAKDTFSTTKGAKTNAEKKSPPKKRSKGSS